MARIPGAYTRHVASFPAEIVRGCLGLILSLRQKSYGSTTGSLACVSALPSGHEIHSEQRRSPAATALSLGCRKGDQEILKPSPIISPPWKLHRRRPPVSMPQVTDSAASPPFAALIDAVRIAEGRPHSTWRFRCR